MRHIPGIERLFKVKRTETLPPQIRERLHALVLSLFPSLHKRRAFSLTNAVLGVMYAAELGIHAIGKGLAAAAGLEAKHAIKQVDRLVGNDGLSPWQLFQWWVPFIVGDRKELVVVLDWTEFDKDGQSTIALHGLTSHGRSTPLVWKSVSKNQLKDRRNSYEDEVIERLHEVLPEDVSVTLLADRGFGDQKRYDHLELLGFNYVIRFRENIEVAIGSGDDEESQPAIDWLHANGRARILKDVRVTRDQYPVPGVVLVRRKGMPQAWCLATNLPKLGARKIAELYAKRFRIEETFRDQKNFHLGMGLSATRIGDPRRRDRLLLLSAIAHALLTLLGAAGEECGLDRTLKANTVKRRTMSLYNQGVHWFSALPNMKEARFQELMQAFDKVVSREPIFQQVFGLI